MKKIWPLIFLLFALVQAAPPELPQGQGVGVAIELEAGCGSTLQPGQPVNFSVTVSQDAYVYVFDVSNDGSITLLVPNKYQPKVRLRAKQTVVFPQEGYSFTVAPKEGPAYLYAVASLVPLPFGSPRGNPKYPQSNPGEAGNPHTYHASELKVWLSTLGDKWGSAKCPYIVSTPGDKAYVRIKTEPAGQRVWIDGEFLGTTPLNYTVDSGPHDLLIDGGEMLLTERFNVAAGGVVELGLVSGNGPSISVSGDPDGARVSLDGVYRCDAPCTVNAQPGWHLLQVTKLGFQPFGVWLELHEHGSLQQIYSLATANASLRIRVSAPSLLFVDGSPYGWVSSQEEVIMQLAPGKHELVATAAGYSPATRVLTVSSGQVLNVELQLRPFKQ
ncbi:PEGA domain-containing protein [Oceanithermus sp.]